MEKKSYTPNRPYQTLLQTALAIETQTVGGYSCIVYIIIIIIIMWWYRRRKRQILGREDDKT
jgi:hypothetical protein